MRILDVSQQTTTTTIGSRSDGADRQVVTTTNWVASVLDDLGRSLTLSFPKKPSDDDVHQAAVAAMPRLVHPQLTPSLASLTVFYQTWRMYQDTLTEATARNAPARIKTALQAAIDGAWSNYAALLTKYATTGYPTAPD